MRGPACSPLPNIKGSIVASVVGGFLDGRTELGVADLAAEDGGAEGEGRRREGDKKNKVGATADPIGPEAEKDQSGEAAEAGDVKERGGLFGRLLVHLHGDVAPVVQRGLDLAGVEAVVGPFPGLHDKRGDGTGEEA